MDAAARAQTAYDQPTDPPTLASALEGQAKANAALHDAVYALLEDLGPVLEQAPPEAEEVVRAEFDVVSRRAPLVDQALALSARTMEATQRILALRERLQIS